MCDSALESVAVGFFDGVHLGHRAILRGAEVALTFTNHPLTVLDPPRAPRLIMSLEERLAAIRACGVRKVVALDFTEELARETAEGFCERLGRRVRCGANWRFGAGGRGDVAFLRERGFDVTVATFAEYAGERISSTRVRAALEAGRIEDAEAMLGRRFAVCGRRQAGKGAGVALGFATMNLSVNFAGRVRLPLGVYAVEVGGRRGVANFGIAPTFGDEAWRQPVLEIHFPDETWREVAFEDGVTPVEFLRFIRPERRFADLDALRRQIAEDVAEAEKHLI